MDQAGSWRNVFFGLLLASAAFALSAMPCAAQQPCEPIPSGMGCESVVCDVPADSCMPVCTEITPASHTARITVCDCRGPSVWGLTLDDGVPSNVCLVPDNGAGTITLPPASCDYLSQDDVYLITDGLPPGSTIELDGPLGQFDCNGATGLCSLGLSPGVCEAAGGTLAGDGQCFSALLDFNLTGTGGMAGFNRSISIPVEVEIHTGPRTPHDAMQVFPADLYRLHGEVVGGDPDFDLLRITAGTDYGLPSPGRTTLTQMPDGNYAVDSFFDISYRIEFVGAPGSALDGLAGATTATIRIDTGNTPSCGGDCPPNMDCSTAIVEVQPGVYQFCCEITTGCDFDFGDAPVGYQTLFPAGASHAILPGFYLGSGIDDEPDGQPSSLADGDDLDSLYPPSNFDDEDGVRFLSPLIPGFPAYVEVTAASGGTLNAWVDFQVDGGWLEPGDHILVDSALATGLNLLRFDVPQNASSEFPSYARFRLSDESGTGPAGGAGIGEVEDYLVTIQPVGYEGSDWGDAPESTYPTLAEDSGASHVVSPSLFLGFTIDPEPDGQPDAVALGDDFDIDPLNPPLNTDDEDGVVFTSALIPGQVGRAEVFVTTFFLYTPVYLSGWIDFLGDGWDAGDVIAAGVTMEQGVNSLQFLVPPTASTGPTYARFRLSTVGNLVPHGPAADGEVEDYEVTLFGGPLYIFADGFESGDVSQWSASTS